jgi:hypothetical protein
MAPAATGGLVHNTRDATFVETGDAAAPGFAAASSGQGQLRERVARRAGRAMLSFRASDN